jgi:hypothetical protein
MWDFLGFVQTDCVDYITSVSLLPGRSNPRQAGTAVLHRVVLSHVLHGIMENLAGDLYLVCISSYDQTLALGCPLADAGMKPRQQRTEEDAGGQDASN